MGALERAARQLVHTTGQDEDEDEEEEEEDE
eukprot:COSAG02_NODE_26448_length_632_cov_4.228893_1_plen_30_part_10